MNTTLPDQFEAFARWLRHPCRCDLFDAARCQCGGFCECHRPEPAPACSECSPIEFSEVPPPYSLSAGIEPAPRWPLKKVDCRKCGAPLRTGMKVAVRRIEPGVFECVRCNRPPVAGPVVLVSSLEVCGG